MLDASQSKKMDFNLVYVALAYGVVSSFLIFNYKTMPVIDPGFFGILPWGLATALGMYSGYFGIRFKRLLLPLAMYYLVVVIVLKLNISHYAASKELQDEWLTIECSYIVCTFVFFFAYISCKHLLTRRRP